MRTTFEVRMPPETRAAMRRLKGVVDWPEVCRTAVALKLEELRKLRDYFEREQKRRKAQGD